MATRLSTVGTWAVCAVLSLVVTNARANAYLPPRTGECTIEAYFLLDKNALMGLGHAALLVGSDEQGWHYFSFSPGHAFRDRRDNLEHATFPTFAAASADPRLKRYDDYLLWSADIGWVGELVADIEGAWASSRYDALRRNCFHMVAFALGAAGMSVDDDHRTPVEAFHANVALARSHGAWPAVAMR